MNWNKFTWCLYQVPSDELIEATIIWRHKLTFEKRIAHHKPKVICEYIDHRMIIKKLKSMTRKLREKQLCYINGFLNMSSLISMREGPVKSSSILIRYQCGFRSKEVKEKQIPLRVCKITNHIQTKQRIFLTSSGYIINHISQTSAYTKMNTRKPGIKCSIYNQP